MTYVYVCSHASQACLDWRENKCYKYNIYPIKIKVNNVVCDFHLKNENEPRMNERVYDHKPKITAPMHVAATCQFSFWPTCVGYPWKEMHSLGLVPSVYKSKSLRLKLGIKMAQIQRQILTRLPLQAGGKCWSKITDRQGTTVAMR